jgi:hypothetical protein
VRKLVDEQQRRLARERSVEIELFQRASAVVDLASRRDLEPGGEPAVSWRPCVSTTPITTSRPCSRWRRASASIA